MRTQLWTNRKPYVQLAVIAALLFGLGLAFATARTGQALDGLPVGFHDGEEGVMNSVRCTAFGWAADPDDPGRDLQVRVLSDDVIVATTTAKLNRPDVSECTGGTCGFNVKLWSKVTPGIAHTIKVEAYDVEGATWVPLSASSKSLTCWGYPLGFHDGSKGNVSLDACDAFGWAADPDNRKRDLRVRILSDGKVITTTIANLYRPDVKACSGGTCGWYSSLSGLISVDRSHLVSAQAFDKETSTWRNLSSTPKALNCLTPSSQVRTFRSLASQDGWILESAEGSGIGGNADPTSPIISVGDTDVDQQVISVLSFKTSDLPDGAKLLSAQVRLTRESFDGAGDPFSILGGLYLDVRKGYFGGASALELEDFDAPASKGNMGPYQPKLVSEMYTINLPSSALAYINKMATRGGLTQLRLRFSLADNDDNLVNLEHFHSGEASNPNLAPKLIITYQVP